VVSGLLEDIRLSFLTNIGAHALSLPRPLTQRGRGDRIRLATFGFGTEADNFDPPVGLKLL
jgi:hypothetical protein